jgi:hypothetical protein
MEHLLTVHALVPDGRIFSQITQKRTKKIVYGRKKLEAVKWQNLAISGRKEAGKYFYKYFGENHFVISQTFMNCFLR